MAMYISGFDLVREDFCDVLYPHTIHLSHVLCKRLPRLGEGERQRDRGRSRQRDTVTGGMPVAGVFQVGGIVTVCWCPCAGDHVLETMCCQW